MRALLPALFCAAILSTAASADQPPSPDDAAAKPATIRPRDPESATRRYLIAELLVTRPLIQSGADQAAAVLAFVDIHNRGKAPDRLIGASIDGTDHVAITPDAGGEQTSIAIEPDADIRMDPDGLHLLLQGLKAPLKDGQTLDGVLRFERAGPLPVQFTVNAP